MPTPLADLWAEYRRSRATESLSDHTWARLETEFTAVSTLIANIVGRGPAETDLTRDILREAFARYSTEAVVRKGGGVMVKRSPGTVAGAISTWNRFVSFLVIEEVVPGNPMAAINTPKVPKGTPKALQGDAPERLIQSLQRGDRSRDSRYPWPERDLALMAFYITTGVRSSELAALKLVDLDIREHESKAHVIGKGSKERWQPVPDSTVLAIAEYMETRHEKFPPKGKEYAHSDPLFVGDHGKGLSRNQIRYIVEKCYEAAGIRSAVPAGALTHALRHTYATRLVKDKNQAPIIQKLLGHGSLNTSQNYISVDDDAVREAAQGSSLAALFKNDA